MALTQGLDVACGDERRRGGVKTLWLTERDNVTDFTTGSDHEYSAVTLTSTAVQFYKFEFTDFTGGFGSEGNSENGSDVQEVSGEFKIPKMEKVKAAILQELKTTCKVVAIYEDYNSKFFVAGYDEVLEEKAALLVTINELGGTDLQDENGYTLVLAGKAAELQREFTGDTTDATKFEQ
jgi:hypothetical protein